MEWLKKLYKLWRIFLRRLPWTKESREPYLALLEYRNTYVWCSWFTCIATHGTWNKTLLLTSNKLWQSSKTVKKSYATRKKAKALLRQTLKATRRTSQVMMKSKDGWWPAKVIARTVPWSYIIKMLTGQIYRRKRWHLKESRVNNSQAETEDHNTVIDETWSEENTSEFEQNLQVPQTTNLRQLQWTKCKPVRYTDSGYCTFSIHFKLHW